MAPQVESQVLEAPRVQAARPGSRPRIEALDMTKGVLVMAMVVYHSFNYSTDYTLGFKYLPFLPPSFVLITGFLISRLYFTPEAARDQRVYGRLFLRGCRLLLLFTLLNVLTQVVGRRKAVATPQGVSYLLDYWYEIYGIGGGQYAAFSVLLPIAYLLLLAPLLILLYRAHPLLVPLIAISVAIFCTTPGQGDDYSVNLALLSAGLIGVIFGRVPDNALSLLRRHWYLPVIVYGGYIVFTYLVWQSRFDQLLNALLALAAIFSLCAAIGAGTLFGRELLIVGRYSLLAYIFQIAFLQIVTRLFGRLEPFTVPFYLQMMLVGLLMILMAEGLQWARGRAAWIDAPYRFVFA
jgi:hypothetical protein